MCGANQRIRLKISRGQAETSRFYPRRVRWRYLNSNNTVMTTPGRGYQVGKVQSLDIQSFSWGCHVVFNSLLRHQASPKSNWPLPWVKFSRPTSLVRNFQDIQTHRDTLLVRLPAVRSNISEQQPQEWARFTQPKWGKSIISQPSPRTLLPFVYREENGVIEVSWHCLGNQWAKSHGVSVPLFFHLVPFPADTSSVLPCFWQWTPTDAPLLAPEFRRAPGCKCLEGRNDKWLWPA